MKYYQEITIHQLDEISPNFVMAKIMQKLHLLFVTQLHKYGEVRCGLSYPEYKSESKLGLGRIIRVFSQDEKALKEIAIASCLKGLSDYVIVSEIKNVPEKVASYAMYKRYRKEGCAGNKARRYMKRHPDCDKDKVEKMYTNALKNKKGREYPYVVMKSASNSHTYSYFVLKEVTNQPGNGAYSTYGTSLGGTVPEF